LKSKFSSFGTPLRFSVSENTICSLRTPTVSDIPVMFCECYVREVLWFLPVFSTSEFWPASVAYCILSRRLLSFFLWFYITRIGFMMDGLVLNRLFPQSWFSYLNQHTNMSVTYEWAAASTVCACSVSEPITKTSVVRFEVFTAVTMKSGVFWDFTLCGSCKNQRFAACVGCQLRLTFLVHRFLSPWWWRR
jgi:hypothetical protein